MTSTITAGTLTVKITETVSLNGSDQGANNTLTVANVNEIFKRIVTVPTSEIGIYTTTDSVAGGSQFKDGRVVYVRLTNKDDTNYMLIVVKNSADDEFVIKLGAGESWMSHIQDTCMNAANYAISDITVGLVNIDTVTARSNTANCDLEVFIASL
jgi:hypothetical protein